MNLRQKQLLTVAAGLLFAFLIFPPWDHAFKPVKLWGYQNSNSISSEVCYGWVWSERPSWDSVDYSISYGRLALQCVAVIVVSGITIVWFGANPAEAAPQ